MTNPMDTAIDTFTNDGIIVGTAVAIVHRGERIYTRYAGYADREAARPVSDDTIFRYDSMTKAWTGVAARILAERGEIDPNAAVADYLPEFTPNGPDGKPADIRVRHLMTHTAGVGIGAGETGPFPYRDAGVNDGMDLDGIPMSENLRRLASVPLLFAPGSEFGYGLSYDILGEIVGRTYGSTLGDAVDSLITSRLGTEGPAFTVPEPRRDRVAQPYVNGDAAPFRMPGEYQPEPGTGPKRNLETLFSSNTWDAGGSGLAGTLDDAVTFFEALRTGSADLVNDMSDLAENRIGDLEAMTPGVGHSYGWGIIVDPTKIGTPQATGTWAWSGGLGNNWWIDPVNELTAVQLSNTTYAGCFGPYPDAVRRAAYALIGR